MPLQIPATDFDLLLDVVGRHPYGVAVKDLLRVPELDFPKRTLQRRLDQLVSEGRLVPQGRGRARRYHIPATPKVAGNNLMETPQTSKGIEAPVDQAWLSLEAREIRALIRRPVTQRTPVGYQWEFLEAYQPNETFYLPPDVRRKLAHIGKVGMSGLPAGTYIRQVMGCLIIDLSWNSSRLEGNTYSLLETKRLLELGENAKGKDAGETQMILNHKAAIEMLADQAGVIGFNSYTVCNLHALLSDNLLPDPAAGGRIRAHAVGIGGSVFHPLEGPQRIEEMFDRVLAVAEAIADPFEQAFFAMLHLPYLQPFEDVNKRVSRLAANIPMVRHNLCPLSFIDVEAADYVTGLLGVYELNRIEYMRDVFVWAYERSCARYVAIRQSLGEPDPFRLLHRTAIARAVGEIVQGRMDKPTAGKWLPKVAARELPEPDRPKFIEVVGAELAGLHMGNIARYRLRPAEFEAWKAGWE